MPILCPCILAPGENMCIRGGPAQFDGLARSERIRLAADDAGADWQAAGLADGQQRIAIFDDVADRQADHSARALALPAQAQPLRPNEGADNVFDMSIDDVINYG